MSRLSKIKRTYNIDCFSSTFTFRDYLKLIKFLNSAIRFIPRKKNLYWLEKETGIPYSRIARCLNVDRISPVKNQFRSFELMLIFEALINSPHIDKIEMDANGITFYSNYLINTDY